MWTWTQHAGHSCTAVRNRVSVPAGKPESALIQWSCMEIDISKATFLAGVVHCWAWLLGFAAISAERGTLELGHAIAFLCFSLSIQSQGQSQSRKGSAWKWKGLQFSVELKWHCAKWISSQGWTLWSKPLACAAVRTPIQCQAVSSVSLYLNSALVKVNYTNTDLPLSSVWEQIMPYMQRLTCASSAGLIGICLIPWLWGRTPALETACPLSEGMEEFSGSRVWLDLLQGKPAHVSIC